MDPIIKNPLNSQSLNPYSYIGNNPLSGTDPTGYDACDADDSGCNPSAGQTKQVQQEVTGSHIKETVGTVTGNADGTVSVSRSGDGPGATQGFGYVQGGNRASNGSQAQSVTAAKTPSSIPTDTAASAISNPQTSDKITEGLLVAGNGSSGNAQNGASGIGPPSQVEIMYDQTKNHGSYSTFAYQIEDANGNHLTGGYWVTEHQDPEPVENSIHDWPPPHVNNGLIHDQVGFDPKETFDQDDHEPPRIQGFTVYDSLEPPIENHRFELTTTLRQSSSYSFSDHTFHNDVTYAAGAPGSKAQQALQAPQAPVPSPETTHVPQ